MTIRELQQEFLTSSEKHLAPEDFFVLLADAAKKDKTFLLAHPEYELDTDTEEKVRKYFARRLKHEPIAYIISHKEFYGHDFIVTKDTLIPRPETEQIVELVLGKIKTQEKAIIADIGTGSGNIIISIAKETEKTNPASSIECYATDISEQALIVAKENAKQHNVDDRIEFRQGDLLQPIQEIISEEDKIIITANLPYLSEEIYQAAADDVKQFEPQSALLSDQAGLDHYYRLLKEVKNISTPSSITLFLEISPEQSLVLEKYILSIFPAASIIIHKDLAEKDRVVEVCL